MKVFIPQSVSEEGINLLKEHGYKIVTGNGWTEEDLIEGIKDCDAALIRTAPYSKKVIEAAPKLKIIARHGVGFDNVDINAAAERGVWVTNTPRALSESVAEFTLALLLTSGKNIVQCSNAMRNGDYKFKNDHKGVDISGKTLGILGFGRIGSVVAEKAHFGLNMNIVAYDPFVSQDKAPDYVKMVSWDEVFKQGDFVSIHIPGGEKNRDAIGEKEFNLMKPNAILLNVARGEVLDEVALDKALKENKFRCAVLDVQKQEPTPSDWALFKNEKVIATPHMASNTVECMGRMSLHAAQQIVKVLSGEKPDWPVNQPKNK
ncbi:hydroxyacid dehydrogenase [uncultured Acidaminococcus sp.]|jgi:D-3-phosphoglycerate dehydrogenase|uniref:hydroxyacid dehydrogenase n=1 Tax=uncultured Acidaminococcus sp. TaxID=352152 RepID=UPI002676B5CA|nr:hydroxyacid dehydrogenase [uncultured Acidaminococcus sp.]